MWTPWRYLDTRTTKMAEDIDGLKAGYDEVKTANKTLFDHLDLLDTKIASLEEAAKQIPPDHSEEINSIIAEMKSDAEAIRQKTSPSSSNPAGPTA
jgi:cell division septum initiation protein DivIVA